VLFVKICGLTEMRGAAAAVEAGADAVGFVFAPSPRRVTPAQAGEIGRSLPRHVLRVGVFVSPALEEVVRIMDEAGLDLAQIHGDLPLSFWETLGSRAIRAVSVGRTPPSPGLAVGRPRFLLLDAYRPGFAGGTGRTFPWAEAASYRPLGIPILIAGGLNPENVRAALAIARPAGVDVSSGVERAPGEKDPDLIAAFVAAVRDWERAQSTAQDHALWR